MIDYLIALHLSTHDLRDCAINRNCAVSWHIVKEIDVLLSSRIPRNDRLPVPMGPFGGDINMMLRWRF